MESSIIVGGKLPLALPKTDGIEITQARENFGELLSKTIEQVNQTSLKGDIAIQKLHTGEAENLHEVMIATAEADISIRMLVQMRNKALEAYNEIMRLQI
ncbi:flagellar hook-basal body complex protein FliE [Desulfopila inferna]|uniref:flagellar hook-basal body complex protein FliE n=1 Tax=Desulfopila inferna TaxID=468528 RepID=UPI00196348CB|nr:flagellar hook-basal body complex protein FliE [Desulfopila inferna]MBM9602968.1 flagellar hook-basal body complex protein FliE [Desulfopila inferna]